MPDRALAYAEAIDQAATGESTPEDLLGFLASDINARLTAQEERALEVERIADTIAAQISASVLAGLQAEIARIHDAADLGQLFEAASASTLTVATGEISLVVADDDKPRFSAPGWILLTATGEDDVWMLGRRVSYDRPSGLLVVDVERVSGLGETASAWSIAAASEGTVPTASDGDYTAAQVIVSPTVLGENRVQAALAAIVTALGDKAPLAGPEFTGFPKAPTAAPGSNTTQLANTAFVQAAIAALLNAAPAALDTLDELAAALGDDADFAATITTALAGKQGLAANLTALTALASIANLAAFAGLTGAADKLGYFTGAGAMALTNFPATARIFLAAASPADQRTAMGLGSIATQAASYAEWELINAVGLAGVSSITWTGLSAYCELRVVLRAASMDATGSILLRPGQSGTYPTSGYRGGATNGLLLWSAMAADQIDAVAAVTGLRYANVRTSCSVIAHAGGGAISYVGMYDTQQSDDALRILSAGGTFDSGTAYLLGKR